MAGSVTSTTSFPLSFTSESFKQKNITTALEQLKFKVDFLSDENADHLLHFQQVQDCFNKHYPKYQKSEKEMTQILSSLNQRNIEFASMKNDEIPSKQEMNAELERYQQLFHVYSRLYASVDEFANRIFNRVQSLCSQPRNVAKVSENAYFYSEVDQLDKAQSARQLEARKYFLNPTSSLKDNMKNNLDQFENQVKSLQINVKQKETRSSYPGLRLFSNMWYGNSIPLPGALPDNLPSPLKSSDPTALEEDFISLTKHGEVLDTAASGGSSSCSTSTISIPSDSSSSVSSSSSSTKRTKTQSRIRHNLKASK